MSASSGAGTHNSGDRWAGGRNCAPTGESGYCRSEDKRDTETDLGGEDVLRGLTDVQGLEVGHASDLEGLTGCTVVLCPGGAVAGADVRGSAPGTRETDLLSPVRLVERVHAVVLCGGSAFGLDAACGVMRFLEERGAGFDTGAARVPIVPAAVLYDLNVGDPRARPDAAMGYQACLAASAGPVSEGNVGAGTGATVGKFFGPAQAMKGGVGSWSEILDSGVVVAALVAVNAFGDVIDPASGEILAGAINPMTGRPARTMDLFRRGRELGDFAAVTNTTLAIVATDAALNKEEANLVARMAHDGLARAICPVHTLYDGDTVFALSHGQKRGDVSIIGAVAAEVLARAVVRGVTLAGTVAGIRAHSDFRAV